MADNRKDSLVRRLKRITLSIYDLEKAESFAEEIISAHEEKSLSKTINAALDLALRISYSRPFTRNCSGKNEDFDERLESDCTSHYTGEEQALHDEIYASRNRIYAHSDPAPRNLRVSILDRGGPVAGQSHDPTDPLALSKVKQFLSMCRKLRLCLTHERHAIADQLEPGEY